MNLKNETLRVFVPTHRKKKESSYIERSLDNNQKSKDTLYMENSRDNDQKSRENEQQLAVAKPLFIFHFHFLQLSACYRKPPRPTTLLLPWTRCLVPFMWTLENVKTNSDNFPGPKLTPTIWMENQSDQE